MALGKAPGGIMAAVAAECCRCAVAVVASRVFVWQDRPTLEREVASYFDPYPWPEGREEPAMDEISTIMVKPERREQKPPSWRAKCRSDFITLPPALLQEYPIVVHC
jgi:hypothetical protein